MRLLWIAVVAVTVAAPRGAAAAGLVFDARSAGSGNWSDPAMWENHRPPRAGDAVQVRPGHVVTYDVESDSTIRIIHVAGTLRFARDRSTRLDVGQIRIQRGEFVHVDGFDCDGHGPGAAGQSEEPRGAGAAVPVLEIGTAGDPIPAGITATIRLTYVPGTDPDVNPSIINCGGRWDVHGAPMSRTWVKLGRPAKAGDDEIYLAEAVTGWKAGNRVIVTGSTPPEYEDGTDRKGDPRKKFGTEERTVVSVDGAELKLDHPLTKKHVAGEDGRCEVANLSRNVVIESADPDGVRGHTVYHRHSTGGISYAEFRHLGKEGRLGRYPLHFHLLRDSMRGGGVVGASIWESKNRWMAIHGTDYLLVRDCVGYGSVGHGYFLEDGTEQYNLLDRNLAVQCYAGKRLPDQALPFDQNEGAGFWWANGRNTLVRNVACENHRYGFRFEINRIHDRDPVLPLRTPDGSVEQRDVRTVPFFRFEDNESHCEGLYSFFFGDDPAGSVRGDRNHPFVARNLRAWQTHYALRPTLAFFLMEKLNVDDAAYGVYHPDYNAHVYRDVRVNRVNAEPINRGHDDESIQFGSFTYDGLRIENCSGMPLIQLTCTAPREGLEGHFRNLTVVPANYPREQRVVDLGVGPVLPDDQLMKGVAYYFHDSAGAAEGKALRVVSVKFPGLMKDGLEYRQVPGFTGNRVRAAEARGVGFPSLLDPVDDLPPATMITGVRGTGAERIVRGVSQDNGRVRSVTVNGRPAKILSDRAGVADWEAVLDAGAAGQAIIASATDDAGNTEQLPAVFPVAR
jgi:hypothetical protein